MKEQKIINYLTAYEKYINNYLNNFDITKDDFNSQLTFNKVELRKYHDREYERAATLVTDDEYVGKTFDNLDVIMEVLEEKDKTKTLAI